MFVIQHDAVETLLELAMEFREFGAKCGYSLPLAPLLAYGHMLCADPHAHTLRATSDLWASDRSGSFRDKLPDGNPLPFTDPLTGEQSMVNPATVHLARRSRLKSGSPSIPPVDQDDSAPS
jgi:hypothetical protein